VKYIFSQFDGDSSLHVVDWHMKYKTMMTITSTDSI